MLLTCATKKYDKLNLVGGKLFSSIVISVVCPPVVNTRYYKLCIAIGKDT